MKQKSTLRKFRDTPEDKKTYLAVLQKGEGFIANSCSGYPEGYMFHDASCAFLDAHKNRNPIRGTTGKIWAATLKELEANESRSRHSGKPAPSLCRCLQTEAPEEYDIDMGPESRLVIPGGQVESNRSRH
jgi:hypothetical protein